MLKCSRNPLGILPSSFPESCTVAHAQFVLPFMLASLHHKGHYSQHGNPTILRKAQNTTSMIVERFPFDWGELPLTAVQLLTNQQNAHIREHQKLRAEAPSVPNAPRSFSPRFWAFRSLDRFQKMSNNRSPKPVVFPLISLLKHPKKASLKDDMPT